MAADRHPGAAPGRGLRAAPPDTDLGDGVTTIRWQITQLGWDAVQGAPKSDAGERTVALDTDTVADIAAWRQEQDKEKEAAGDAWADSGFEFTDELGSPLHPAAVTDAFHMIAYLAGLPPIRLHDLRHGAATLLLAAGHDMKVVQETLGLSSITIAADTYTSVLPQLARKSAEDVAALIRPAGQAPTPPGKPHQASAARAHATRQGRPGRPHDREGNTMSSRPARPPTLAGVPRRARLRARGQPTWHDHHTPDGIIRVVYQPGEETQPDLPDPGHRLPVQGHVLRRHPGRRDHRRSAGRAPPASRCRDPAAPARPGRGTGRPGDEPPGPCPQEGRPQ